MKSWSLVLLLLSASFAWTADWPNWRGPDNQGHAPDQKAPLAWSRTENIRWRVDLPDAGNSTPVIWGDRVFVTQATDKKMWPPNPPSGGPASAETRSLLCFHRADGKRLWEARVVHKETELTHSTNPFCSASPVTDGERVIVSHGSAGLFCYDLDGKELWRKETGKQEHIWGNASSPILYKDLCLLWVGPGERQVLIAMQKTTGKTVWEHTEPGGASGTGSSKEWRGSWSTPIVARINGRDELILSVPEKVKAFDPLTGKELWSCGGLGKLVYTSPLVSADGTIVVLSGYGGPSLAVKGGGSGDVTMTHRLWHNKGQNPQRIGSGVLVGEHVYILNDTGTAMCLEVKTGKDLWEAQRLAGTWSSMVAVGDRLYVPSKAGEVYVLRASPKFEELARNRLGEQTYSSLAFADGEIYFRTFKGLWCIGAK